MCDSLNKNLFTIASEGIECVLSPLGASLCRVIVTRKDGNSLDIALPAACFEHDACEPSLTGRTIAPCCGRIRDSEITIGGETIRLTLNENENHIHGGPEGAWNRIWRGEQISETTVRFTLHLPDGCCGYPGNRELEAVYTAESHGVSVRYSAVTDRTTYMDMTNHVYWDLSGRFDGSAMLQRLRVPSEYYVRNDEHHLPTEILPVRGTPFDFFMPTDFEHLKECYPEDDSLRIARGWNNALLIEDSPAAVLEAPDGSLSMTLTTDAPCLVLYTGGFLGPETELIGSFASPGCAVALEAQDLPDTFHLKGTIPRVLNPGEIFQRCITWRFE